MLEIRTQQFKTFFMATAGPYREAAAELIEARFPEARGRLGPEGVSALIEASLEKGFEYGLEEDDDILVVLELMVRWGARFDDDPRYPWVREFLADEDLEPETRLDLVVQRFSQLSPPREEQAHASGQEEV